jgi:predicted RNA methylase
LLDRCYGVDTAGRIHLDVHDEHRQYYIASRWFTLRKALPRHEVTRDDVFADLGCGKGRMVLEAASRYPFRRVVGVELAEEIYAVARANVDRAQRRSRKLRGRIELSNADVLDFPIADDVTVVSLFNPFRGTVFDTAMRRLVESVDRAPRDVTVIYANPFEHDLLNDIGRFRLTRVIEGRLPTNVYRLAA